MIADCGQLSIIGMKDDSVTSKRTTQLIYVQLIGDPSTPWQFLFHFRNFLSIKQWRISSGNFSSHNFNVKKFIDLWNILNWKIVKNFNRREISNIFLTI